MPPSVERQLRVTRNLQDRLSDLHHSLDLRDFPRALRCLGQCADLDRTSEQTRHLARVAFNASVDLRSLGRSGEALACLRSGLGLAREAGDRDTADRCLLSLARHRMCLRDLQGTKICLDLLSADTFQSSLLRVQIFQAKGDLRKADLRWVWKALELAPRGVKATKILFRLLQGSGSGIVMAFLEKAFDLCSREEEKGELYKIALAYCASGALIQETEDLLQSYVSWSCSFSSSKGHMKKKVGLYETVMRLSHRHVRAMSAAGLDESVVACCRALLFLARENRDERSTRAFLWHYVNSLLRLGKLQETEKAMRMYQAEMASNDQDWFLPLRLDVAVARGDFAEVKEILQKLKESKAENSALTSSLMCTVVSFLHSAEPGIIFSLVQSLLLLCTEHDVGPRRKALLVETVVSLLLKSSPDGEDKNTEEESANLWKVLALVRDTLPELQKHGNSEWLSRVLWNKALETQCSQARFRVLSLLRRLLPPDDERLLSNLLLLLASAVALAEGREDAPPPTFEMKEELKELMSTAQIELSSICGDTFSGGAGGAAAGDAGKGEVQRRQRRLVAVYRTRLMLLLEERFNALARSVTSVIEDPKLDARTFMLVARLMDQATVSRKSCLSYGKLVCRVYR